MLHASSLWEGYLIASLSFLPSYTNCIEKPCHRLFGGGSHFEPEGP